VCLLCILSGQRLLLLRCLCMLDNSICLLIGKIACFCLLVCFVLFCLFVCFVCLFVSLFCFVCLFVCFLVCFPFHYSNCSNVLCVYSRICRKVTLLQNTVIVKGSKQKEIQVHECSSLSGQFFVTSVTM